MNQELLRIIDSIARDKNIEKDSVFTDIEAALMSAAKKFYGETDDVQCSIDRMSGEIEVRKNGVLIEYREFGRIAAQTAKQVLIQKLREDERGSIMDEFSDRKGQIITGTVSASDDKIPVVTVNLGRCEGFLPRSEQIPGEKYDVGQRIRALVLEVRPAGNHVKIVLSRSHPDFIRRLFEIEVPEVQEKVIEIKSLAREAGYRTKIAVSSVDSKVDCIGACVGVRGSRIKNIVDELGGERIDIVRWNESSQMFIVNALKPAEIVNIFRSYELARAVVIVDESKLSLAIGKRGQNVRLAAKLTGWELSICTPEELEAHRNDLAAITSQIDNLPEHFVDRLLEFGIIQAEEIEEVGAEPIAKTLDIPLEKAERMIEIARVYLKEKAASEKKRAQERAAKAADDAAGEDAIEPVAAEIDGAAPAAGPDGTGSAASAVAAAPDAVTDEVAGGEGSSAEPQEHAST